MKFSKIIKIRVQTNSTVNLQISNISLNLNDRHT